MNLIDRDALIANIGIADDCLICKKASLLGCKGTERDFVHACECITDAPTIDAVEVVRCKDCKHNMKSPEAGNACCDIFYGMKDQNGFCHMGERRTDE